MNSYGVENNNIIITLSFYLAAAYRLVPSINKIFVSYQQIKFGKPSIPRVMEYRNLKKTNIFFDEKNLLKTLSFEKEIRLMFTASKINSIDILAGTPKDKRSGMPSKHDTMNMEIHRSIPLVG